MTNYWKEGDPIYYMEGNVKIYKYRVRYGQGEGGKAPYDYLVCEHLTPEDVEPDYWTGSAVEQVYAGIVEMLANDPGWLNNYQVRYCQACGNEYDAEEERIQKQSQQEMSEAKYTEKQLKRYFTCGQIACDGDARKQPESSPNISVAGRA